MTEQQLQEIETSHYRMPVVLALIAEIRRLREQQGRELIARVEAIEQGNGLAQRLIAERDAALVERDALLVRVDQWRQMADREATAHVEMRAERDAARNDFARRIGSDEEFHAMYQRAWNLSDVDGVGGSFTLLTGLAFDRLEAQLTEARLVLREGAHAGSGG